jgi:hypothetical protein
MELEYKISKWTSEFRNKELEAEYRQSQLSHERISVSAGLGLHLACVLWQVGLLLTC